MRPRASPPNKLLPALPPEVCERLLPHLELVPLKLGARCTKRAANSARIGNVNPCRVVAHAPAH
jgi:hypothetical protein